jgi:hypothetical protein
MMPMRPTLIDHRVRKRSPVKSTDWALKHVVEPAVPGTVRLNGRQTADCLVRVELSGAAEDPLLADFSRTGLAGAH